MEVVQGFRHHLVYSFDYEPSNQYCLQQVPPQTVTVVTQQPVLTQVTFGESPVTCTASDGVQVRLSYPLDHIIIFNNIILSHYWTTDYNCYWVQEWNADLANICSSLFSYWLHLFCCDPILHQRYQGCLPHWSPQWKCGWSVQTAVMKCNFVNLNPYFSILSLCAW